MNCGVFAVWTVICREYPGVLTFEMLCDTAESPVWAVLSPARPVWIMVMGLLPDSGHRAQRLLDHRGELAGVVRIGGIARPLQALRELRRISRVAVKLKKIAPIAVRVNPNVDAGTHAKISTGRARDKFGIAHADIPALYARAASLPGIRPVGLASHIGSQILSTAPYRDAYERLLDDALAVSRAARLRRPVLVGHSWGAMVALEAAARHRRAARAGAAPRGRPPNMRDAMATTSAFSTSPATTRLAFAGT
mgnify:CR=1 FL=1